MHRDPGSCFFPKFSGTRMSRPPPLRESGWSSYHPVAQSRLSIRTGRQRESNPDQLWRINCVMSALLTGLSFQRPDSVRLPPAMGRRQLYLCVMERRVHRVETSTHARAPWSGKWAARGSFTTCQPGAADPPDRVRIKFTDSCAQYDASFLRQFHRSFPCSTAFSADTILATKGYEDSTFGGASAVLSSPHTRRFRLVPPSVADAAEPC